MKAKTMQKNMVWCGLALVAMVALAQHGLANEAPVVGPTLAESAVQALNAAISPAAAEAAPMATATPALDLSGLQTWFFGFLQQLLGLFADFIGQILGQVFSGIGGLMTGGGAQ
jgi:hypothetical protein